MQALTFKPRVAPRDASDALITTGCGILQAAILLGIPGLIVLALTHRPLVALLCVLFLNVFFVLMAVSRIDITDEGIRFVRMLGGPRFIAWNAVKQVEVAPRKELIVRGWLWPMFPPREFTTSLTSLGHYRIAFGDRVVYFAPKDEAGFVAAVRQQLDRRLPRDGAAAV